MVLQSIINELDTVFQTINNSLSELNSVINKESTSLDKYINEKLKLRLLLSDITQLVPRNNELTLRLFNDNMVKTIASNIVARNYNSFQTNNIENLLHTNESIYSCNNTTEFKEYCRVFIVGALDFVTNIFIYKDEYKDSIPKFSIQTNILTNSVTETSRLLETAIQGLENTIYRQSNLLSIISQQKKSLLLLREFTISLIDHAYQKD